MNQTEQTTMEILPEALIREVVSRPARMTELDTERALMVEQQMDYARTIVHKVNLTDISAEELYDAAYEGLCKAALAYNPNCGTTFKTFLLWYVVWEVIVAIREIRGTESCSVDEIADAERKQESLPEWVSAILPEAAEEPWSTPEEYDHLRWVVSTLNERDREVVERVYGLNGRQAQTIENAARAMGVSRRSIIRWMPGIKRRIKRRLL